MSQFLYRIERDFRTMIGLQRHGEFSPITDGMNAVRRVLTDVEGVQLVEEIELGRDVLYVTLEFDEAVRRDAVYTAWNKRLPEVGVRYFNGTEEADALKAIASAYQEIKAANLEYALHHHRLDAKKQEILAEAKRRATAAGN